MKPIKDLIAKTNFVARVQVTEVKAIKENGWTISRDHVFKSKDIFIKRIYLGGGTKNVNISYFDKTEKVTKHCVVPPDFMIVEPPNEEVKELVEAYEAMAMNNLYNEILYSGKIGSDPEIFIEKKNGEVLPAFDFLGSKEKPNTAPGYNHANGKLKPSKDVPPNTLYWDGFQAEFTTTADSCMGWHGDSLQAGLRGIYKLLKKHNKTAKLSAKTVMDIPPELLLKSTAEHVAFGCNASLNVYGMEGLQAPGQEVPYRSAGGHIHFGMAGLREDAEAIKNVVKALDAILGVAGVSLCAKFDDPRRRIMYGLAGEYRLPPHGLEYRVLSNAWLFHPLIANIVFDLARSAAMFGKKGLLKFWKATEEETVQVINTCNVEGAREILKRNKDLLIKILNVKLSDEKMSEYTYNVIVNGMESVLEDPTDIVTNWDLDKVSWSAHCDGPGKNVHKVFDKQLQDKKV